jgi:hypothetical protein
MIYDRETRLFRLEVTYPEGALRPVEGHYPDDDPDDTYYELDPTWRPAGWVASEWWLERFKTDAFFWPKPSKMYFSRSAARTRARLFEAYGATVRIRCTKPVEWEYSDAEMLRERVAELEAELALTRERVTA